MDKNLNRLFFPKKACSWLRVIYSTSLMVGEMQIKTTMRYHSMPVRIAVIKKMRNRKCL